MGGSSDLREQKRLLRRQCFAAVKSLGDEKKAECSAEICGHLENWNVFKEADSVGIYIAVGSEPDLGDVIWNSSSKQFALARIGEDETLHFHRIQSKDDLVIGEFGIAEPNPDTCPAVSESELDLVVVPGVGFNPVDGARLGRGKGHYDRFLERFKTMRGGDKSILGVSFSVQQLEIEAESHDQPMDFLISEEGILKVL